MTTFTANIEFEVYASNIDTATNEARKILQRFLGDDVDLSECRISMSCTPGTRTGEGTVNLWCCEVRAVRP